MGKSIYNTMSSEEFAELVAESRSISDMLRKYHFGTASGTMRKIITDRIELEGLDTSHFSKNGSYVGKRGYAIYPLEEILVENSTYTCINSLKRRLVNNNLLEYKCEYCGNKGEWNGKPLHLQLEHKNGIHNDHRLENLCFICPNCHSQTETYAGRNAGRYKTVDVPSGGIDAKVEENERKKQPTCSCCGKKLRHQTKTGLCRQCYNNSLGREINFQDKYDDRTVDKPSKDELYKLLSEQSFTSVANLYGVSDNAVKKWCDKYSIPRYSSYYRKLNS